ncbi:MAG: hypothetical protein Q7J98_07180 [Kiritimatiellia bacterium]|nr:hypothetical protein [Kiritimatiellia bacterium]
MPPQSALIVTGAAQAQVGLPTKASASVGSSISADGTAPNDNAMLDVQSPSTGDGKGILVPRVTANQRTNANASLSGGLLDNSGDLRGGAAHGLIVYQTDGIQGLYFNTSLTATPAWALLGADGSSVSIGPSANGFYFGAAMGYAAEGTNHGVAVGYQANGSAGGVAVGYQANGYDNGVALGRSANGSVGGAAVGRSANGYIYSAALGYQANGYWYGAAVGTDANGINNGAAVGTAANGSDYGTAVGRSANGAQTNVAIGYNANAQGGTERIAIGHNVNNTNDNTAVIRGHLYLDGGTGIWTRVDFGSGAWEAKAFEIDHPLDPENKILRHFCIEGPQVWNVYAGNAQLVNGVALVELPDYYSALNLVGSEIYGLTPIGGLALLAVGAEVNENQFTIIGDGDVKVSWTIKVLRNDPGCLEDLRRRPVEQRKDEILNRRTAEQ